jgi:hypothetical protein
VKNLNDSSFNGRIKTDAVDSEFPLNIKVKVKVTLEEATRGQRGSRELYCFFNFGARWGGWSKPRPDRFTPGKASVPIV